MKTIETTSKHIYCLEGNWTKNPRSNQSIKPILELLNTTLGVKYIYRKCNTKDELVEYLRQYTFKRYQNYTILYLAFHGRKNELCLGGERITLNEIANTLDGKLTGKIIHFGSCLTLGTTENKITDFRNKTECLFISGFKKTVGYIDSTAFDLIYLGLLQHYYSYAKIKSKITKSFHTLAETLCFVFM